MVRITELDDGTTRVATHVSVKVNYLVYTYRYEFTGQETWRGNRLVSTDNHATDDGKKFDARAVIGARGFQIEANGRSRGVPSIHMTTNYWRMPDVSPEQTLTLMNADRGTIHRASVERLADEPFRCGSETINCSRYRLAGDVQADLWSDRRGRIVRQKSVEDGYPTELRLTRLSREAPQTAQGRPAQPLR